MGTGVLLQPWAPSGCSVFGDQSLQTMPTSITSSPKSRFPSKQLKEPASFAHPLSDVIEAAGVGRANPAPPLLIEVEG